MLSPPNQDPNEPGLLGTLCQIRKSGGEANSGDSRHGWKSGSMFRCATRMIDFPPFRPPKTEGLSTVSCIPWIFQWKRSLMEMCKRSGVFGQLGQMVGETHVRVPQKNAAIHH